MRWLCVVLNESSALDFSEFFYDSLSVFTCMCKVCHVCTVINPPSKKYSIFSSCLGWCVVKQTVGFKTRNSPCSYSNENFVKIIKGCFVLSFVSPQWTTMNWKKKNHPNVKLACSRLLIFVHLYLTHYISIHISILMLLLRIWFVFLMLFIGAFCFVWLL